MIDVVAEEHRQWVRRALLVLLSALALAPAGWRLSRKNTAASEPGEIVLTYMAWGNPQQLDAERKIIAMFNQKSLAAGRRVRVELFMPPAAGYGQKLRLMLASGNSPDIMRVDHYDFPSLVPKGYFCDLTDLAAADPSFHVEDFHPAAQHENYYNGRLYATNMLFGGVVCYYNQDLFKQALLPDPYDLWKQGEWTWEKFEECARALTTRRGSRTVQYGFLLPGSVGGGTYNWSWFLWVWGEGGEILSPDGRTCLLDSPQALAAMQRYRDLRFKWNVAPTPADITASPFSLESGNVAMEFNYAGMAPRYRDSIRDFRWDIVPTPYAKGRPYGLVKGTQLVMAANCQHPHEAWEWIKFMVSPEVELLLYGDRLRRNVPTRRAMLSPPPGTPIENSYIYATKPFFHTDVIPFLLDHAKELPIDLAWPVWTREADRYMETLFVEPDAAAADVMPKAKAAIDRVLAEEHARYQRYEKQEAEHGN